MHIHAKVSVPEENRIYWTLCSLKQGKVFFDVDDSRVLIGEGGFGAVGFLSKKDAQTVQEWQDSGEPVTVPKFKRKTDDNGNESIIALITTESAPMGKTAEVEYFDNPFEDC